VTYERAWRLSRTELAHMAEQLSKRVTGGLGFSCFIATGEALRKLNRDFRKKDETTDVLSFPSSLSPGFAGDLAISIDHARAQARALGHSVEQEISVLMLHGVLHLMGMDHETDKGQMRRSETRWRKMLCLPVSLTERAALPDYKPGGGSLTRRPVSTGLHFKRAAEPAKANSRAEGTAPRTGRVDRRAK
jgi:probable rRNA maturation factor